MSLVKFDYFADVFIRCTKMAVVFKSVKIGCDLSNYSALRCISFFWVGELVIFH